MLLPSEFSFDWCSFVFEIKHKIAKKKAATEKNSYKSFSRFEAWQPFTKTFAQSVELNIKGLARDMLTRQPDQTFSTVKVIFLVIIDFI